MANPVAFVGPLPPPVNGFSTVCALMLKVMQAKVAVTVFDRAPRGGAFRALLRQAAVLLRFLGFAAARRPLVLYLALSGGGGQLIDILYLLVCRMRRGRVFIHHHSFGYINARSRLSRAVFAVARGTSQHIVLSRGMGLALSRAYGIEAADVRVVSNAAFAPVTSETLAPAAPGEPLRIGFLSNITFEKGFVEFFAVLKQLHGAGIAYRARVAGPLQDAARDTFERLLRESHEVEYLGPLYGTDKDAFYRSLDIFLFPTRYANEAEPLVLYEAMRCAVYCIACERGAIAEMVENGAGLACPAALFVAAASEQLAVFARDRDSLLAARRRAQQQAHRVSAAGAHELDVTLSRMLTPFRARNSPGLA